MTETFLVVGFFVVVGPLIWWLMWWEDFEGMRSSAEFRRDCKTRSLMDADEFYARFYSETDLPKELVTQFRELEAKFWGVEAGMVRPQDDYPRINGDLGSADFVRAIEEKFSIAISDADCERLDGSFDTLVRFVHSRCKTAA